MRMRLRLGLIIVSLGVSGFASFQHCRAGETRSDNILIADFESTSYGDWKATGTAFSHGPASGALARRLQLENFHGNGVLTTKIDGDGPTGTLTSLPFQIQRKYISFLISGGKWQHETCLNLLVDGQVVHSSTGANNIHLEPTSWNVRALLGKTATDSGCGQRHRRLGSHRRGRHYAN